MTSGSASSELSRARGAFLGVAVGDALGATVEFMSPREIRARYGVHDRMRGGGWLGLAPGQVTDDTEMSLCVARALVHAGGCRPHEIMRRFVAWADGGPVDVGATCLSGIERYRRNGRLDARANKLHGGNGALMRMAPVAIFTVGDDEALRQCARVQAHLTHNHPLSDAACLAVGRMVHAGISGQGREAMEDVALALARAFPECAFRPYRGRATGYVADTLATVFHYFLSAADFEECLVGVVNQGGDADTNAAVAGMLCGALYGEEGLPETWLAALRPEVVGEIRDLATRLSQRSPCRRGTRSEG